MYIEKMASSNRLGSSREDEVYRLGAPQLKIYHTLKNAAPCGRLTLTLNHVQHEWIVRTVRVDCPYRTSGLSVRVDCPLAAAVDHVN